MTRHYTDEDLTLHYYGESRRPHAVEGHLEACADCAARYREIAAVLTRVPLPVLPERGDQYGREVWQRIRPQIDDVPGPRSSWFAAWPRLAWTVAAAAVVIAAAFIAGQRWRPQPAPPAPVERTAVASDADGARRILLTSVADHLDRSERVLTDIMNAPDASDISVEQAWAEDLLTASRLYRQDALVAGEQSVASVLDEIERNLLEIVHSPSRVGDDDLEQIRRRIDAASLLFKVRVLEDELRRRNKTS